MYHADEKKKEQKTQIKTKSFANALHIESWKRDDYDMRRESTKKKKINDSENHKLIVAFASRYGRTNPFSLLKREFSVSISSFPTMKVIDIIKYAAIKIM